MEITDSFEVAAPLTRTWNTLLDIERIAPCLPGAQLQEIEGDEYRGVVKVKVGPITAQYKGAATLATVDEATRTVVIDAKGRDTRGAGNANATVTVNMAETAAGGTAVKIRTDLHVTGKVAQFGRGTMAEVSAKLLKQFVENLERDVLGRDDEPTEVVVDSGAPHDTGAPAQIDHHDGAAGNGAAPAAAPTVRKVDHAEAKPVDLMDAAGASVAKRALPLIGVLLVLFVILRRRKRR